MTLLHITDIPWLLVFTVSVAVCHGCELVPGLQLPGSLQENVTSLQTRWHAQAWQRPSAPEAAALRPPVLCTFSFLLVSGVTRGMYSLLVIPSMYPLIPSMYPLMAPPCGPHVPFPCTPYVTAASMRLWGMGVSSSVMGVGVWQNEPWSQGRPPCRAAQPVLDWRPSSPPGPGRGPSQGLGCPGGSYPRWEAGEAKATAPAHGRQWGTAGSCLLQTLKPVYRVLCWLRLLPARLRIQFFPSSPTWTG